VYLIEVNVVGTQPAQAGIDGRKHVLARKSAVVRSASHLHPALCGEHELFALSSNPSANDLLGATHGFERHWHGIHVGCVDEVDAACGGLVHDPKGGLLVALITKSHRSEADFGHFQPGASQAFRIQERSPFRS